MPYLCNRYNKHIRLILLFTGNRVSHRAIQQQTKTLIGIDYDKPIGGYSPNIKVPTL